MFREYAGNMATLSQGFHHLDEINNEEPNSLDYNSVFIFAVKAIQELSEKVTKLEQEIVLLKG